MENSHILDVGMRCFRYKILIISGMLSLLGPFVSAAECSSFEITSVEPFYIQGDEFKRIGEYFGGQGIGQGSVLRTDECDRSGLYFILNLDRSARKLPEGAQIVLEYVRSDIGEEQKEVFLIKDELSRSREIYLGLTGDAWPGPGVSVVAWNLTLLSSEGFILGNRASFTWRITENKGRR